MFAAAAPLPFYSTRNVKSNVKPQSVRTRDEDVSPVNSSKPSSTSTRADSRHHASQSNIETMMQPAIDGPPSPGKIRALSRHLQRAAVTESSVGSRHRAPTLEGPVVWEHSMDHISLSRRSSTRSTSSSMPSRERHESVQLFGKTIFSRRARTKRESSSNSSSGSSLYSTDLSLDVPIVPSKEALTPSIFGLRKMSKGDITGDRLRSNSVNGKKLQISGPYNFQHVSHTRRDEIAGSQPSAGGEATEETVAATAPFPSPTAHLLGNIESAEATPNAALVDMGSADSKGGSALWTSSQQLPPSPLSPTRRYNGPSSPQRRTIMRTQSSDQIYSLASSQDGSPRSRVEQYSTPYSAPLPPPRMSSRATMRHDDLTYGGSIRPQSSSSFRQPEPYMPANDYFGRLPTIPDDSDGLPVCDERYSTVFSHAITTPDDAAWPLTATSAATSFDTGLADVPEEDENTVTVRRCRLSLASNHSSLRGSHSVPLLRQSAQFQSDASQRPLSGLSDTLGRMDTHQAKRASKAFLGGSPAADDLDPGCWEDDIDYAYEHEVEADCDYAWDRPSLDLDRGDSTSSGPALPRGRLDGSLHVGERPGGRFSYIQGQDTIQFPPSSGAGTANFSRPQVEPSSRRPSHFQNHGTLRTSTLKESFEFTHSPSLLIPNDFRQQLTLASVTTDDKVQSSDGTFAMLSNQYGSAFGTGVSYVPDRASTSTTASDMSRQSGSSDDRHKSTTSTLTDLTRYTGSTTFEGWDPKALELGENARSVASEDFPDFPSPSSMSGQLGPLFESEELMSHSTDDLRTNHSSVEHQLSRESLPVTRSKETILKHKRQRAHTTSLSMPSRGYALFPPAYVGSRTQ